MKPTPFSKVKIKKRKKDKQV